MRYEEVAMRLEKTLGLGEFPMVRRRLYARLQRLVEQKGDGPLKVIADLIQEASGPKIRDKGQYFCWVVKRRMKEAGWPIEASAASAAGPGQADQVRAMAVKACAPEGDAAGDAARAELERLRLSNDLLRRERDSLMRERGRGAF